MGLRLGWDGLGVQNQTLPIKNLGIIFSLVSTVLSKNYLKFIPFMD